MFKKFRATFHDDWCPDCYEKMEVLKKQLYILPLMVGHYESHSDASYYIKNLTKINKKAEITPGFYACGAYLYRCPNCGNQMVKLSIFLPVRDQEKYEETFFIKSKEMINYILEN